uniref:Uncharacterized protein n=1 Tax=uncultured prokaryote TaxID=198431 RepID=A0A0H5Q3Z6_9ZZZZ|nr:hypothetical protein [uncultured prokaryote]
MNTQGKQITIRIRGWASHPGWVVATARASWFVVADRSTHGRDITETWFAQGSMTEREVVITALLELARALKDEGEFG